MIDSLKKLTYITINFYLEVKHLNKTLIRRWLFCSFVFIFNKYNFFMMFYNIGLFAESLSG